MKNILLFLAVSLPIFANDLPSYLQAMPKEQARQARIVYSGEGFDLVVKDSQLQNADLRLSENLYAARFQNVSEILPKLKSFGELLYLSSDSKEAIMRISEPEHVDMLAALLHEHGGVIGCGSLVPVLSPAEVSPVPTIVQESIDSCAARNTAEKNSDIQKLVGMVNNDNIRQFVQDLSAYRNRFHRSTHGANAANFIYESFQHFASSNANLSVRKVTHSNTPQPSIVATLKGSNLPDEIVIVGCHIDSINGWGGSNEQDAPGADDNASGTATVREILRIMTTYGYKFKRTIEFHGYAAEEAGLVGSSNIARDYKSAGKKVVGMIQIDMNLFLAANASPTIWLITNDTDSRHNDIAVKLIEQYTNVPWKKGQLWAGTSDHKSWFSRGYPAIFPFEDPGNHNGKIHTAADTIASSGNFTLAGNFAKLGIAYLSTLAEIHTNGQ